MAQSPEFETVKREATRGVAWAGAESVLRQLIQITAQLLLARLLAPADFGVLGMALVFQGVAQLLADFGIGSAIVQKQQPDPLTLSSSFWANLAVSSLLALLMVASAPLVGQFYASDEVVPVVQALSLSLLLGGLRTLPRALLYKDLQFGVLARIGIVSSFVGTGVALTMAATGFGLWSLVAQPLAGNITETVLLWLANRWRPQWAFSWASMRDVAHFSYGVLGTNLLNYASRNADNLLIGKVLGSNLLGYYALAYQIMLYPLSQVAGVIVKVMFPALSRLQNEPEQVRAAFLGGVSMIAFVTFPMMLGLYAVSSDFIIVVFGEKWLPMRTVLEIFCGIGLQQSIGTTVGTIYMATGHSQLMLRVTLYLTPLILASFVVGLQWGIEGVAACYGVVSLVLFFVLARIALKLIGLRVGTMLIAMARPLLAALLMLVGTLAVVQALPSASPAMRLTLASASGAVLYILITFVINRAQALRLLALIRSAFGRPTVS